MKLRWLKTIGMAYLSYSGIYPDLYVKKEEETTVLQYYDEEFSSWVDVPTVVERKGEK